MAKPANLEELYASMKAQRDRMKTVANTSLADFVEMGLKDVLQSDLEGWGLKVAEAKNVMAKIQYMDKLTEALKNFDDAV